ncbi:hypothetical protein BGZ94_005229 [Podila epigama]|nr:hypothetical protein BGZ94_005229 [Podila epigama]
MVHTNPGRCIPDEIIQSNRKHIRYLSHSRLFGRDIPQATQLKELSLELSGTATLHQEIALLEANPGLRSLHLLQKINSPDLSPSLFKPLTALQYLNLGGINKGFSPELLKSILDSNQHLGTLILNYNSTLETDFDDWCVYPNIKIVHFRYNTSNFSWYFHLLQRCANLEVLALNEVRQHQCDRRPQFALLSRILQDHCQKVKILRYDERYDEMPADMLTTKDYLNVIKATSNLVRLRLSMNSFSTVLCDALLHGSIHSLESLSLDIQGEFSYQESIVSAGRVLSSCPELQRLQLLFEYYPLYSNDTEKPLAAQPWICNNLKTIALKPRRRIYTSCESSCECKTSEEARTIGVACDAEIQKQGWKYAYLRYKDHHIPWRLKENRVVLLSAASALPHVAMVHLGHEQYDHIESISAAETVQCTKCCYEMPSLPSVANGYPVINGTHFINGTDVYPAFPDYIGASTKANVKTGVIAIALLSSLVSLLY